MHDDLDRIEHQSSLLLNAIDSHPLLGLQERRSRSERRGSAIFPGGARVKPGQETESGGTAAERRDSTRAAPW
jgi:hypothetical protein